MNIAQVRLITRTSHAINALQEARCSQLSPQGLLRLTSPRCSMVFSPVATRQIPKFPLKLLAQSPKFFHFLHVFDFLFDSTAIFKRQIIQTARIIITLLFTTLGAVVIILLKSSINTVIYLFLFEMAVLFDFLRLAERGQRT
jgi:hypothetical protein